MKQIMTFPRKCEFEKARSYLDRLGLPYETVSPAPGCARVGVESLVMSQEARAAMFHEIGAEVVSAGWVDLKWPLLQICSSLGLAVGAGALEDA